MKHNGNNNNKNLCSLSYRELLRKVPSLCRLKTEESATIDHRCKQSQKTDWTVRSDNDTAWKSMEQDQPADKENTFINSHSKGNKQQLPDLVLGHHKNESMAHYFLSEIKMIVLQLPRFNRQRIAYMDYLEILRQLNMIQHNYEPLKDDAASRLWSILVYPSKDNNTCLVNLSIMLMAVMNISLRVNSVVEFYHCIPSITDQNKSPIGNFKKIQPTRQYSLNKDGYFDLSITQVDDIHARFQQFRVTRMYLGQISRKSEKTERDEYPYRPNISSKSRSLAKPKKNKSHFHSTHSEYQCQRQLKQTEECTFQPNKSRHKISRQAGNTRSNILYEISRTSREKTKKDKSKDDIEYEKSPENYTFRPAINIRKKSQQKSKPINGESKEVQRMIRARIDKEVKKIASSKGIPYIKKNIQKLRKDVSLNYTRLTPEKKEQARKSTTAEDKQKRVLFTFEVYLEQQTSIDKIVMYEGDDPVQVASQFAQKHNLKLHLQSKLLNILKQYMGSLKEVPPTTNLKEIQEESFESSLDL